MLFRSVLRDTIAHGDARNVEPFNIPDGSNRLLAGFTFRSSRGSKKNVADAKDMEITLVASDMKQIAEVLADKFCIALSVGNSEFCSDARRHILDAAA